MDFRIINIFEGNSNSSKEMKIVKKSFAQNYLIQNPFIGTLILTLFYFGFVMLYQPFRLDHNTLFHFTISMFLYSLGGSLSFSGFIFLIKALFPSFFLKKNWTLLKELLTIFFSLLIMGIVIYFLGNLLNIKKSQINISGLFGAVKMTFLVGVIPFLFFTIKNIGNPYVTTKDIENERGVSDKSMIEIQSALKEKLQISVDNLIYIVSNGNYVDFYLNLHDKIIRKTLRNSLNDIEKQLQDFPFCIRTHRAFLVNMKFIKDKKGNVQAYRLKLDGIDEEIPVSRKKITEFDSAFDKFNS